MNKFSVVFLVLFAAAPAAAQERPFVFSFNAPDAPTRGATVRFETGVGERAFDVQTGDGVEQRVGLQAGFGQRFTLFARVGLVREGSGAATSQQAEMLYSVLQAPTRGVSLAMGMGVRYESAGSTVLLGRVAGGRSFSAWRVDGNLLFEKPFSTYRDALDLITTFGAGKQVTRHLRLGVEAVGEDLEGFWDPNEAEGGARLLIGPSFHVAAANRWEIAVAGGPVLHATRSGLTSAAVRALPDSAGRNGYAVRTSIGYTFSNP
jgi:hypothetical protein